MVVYFSTLRFLAKGYISFRRHAARVLRASPFILASINASLALALPTSRSDFNADGRADILWRNTSTGQNYIYPMNGTLILATEGYLRTVADLNWTIVGVGDFDGDGKA